MLSLPPGWIYLLRVVPYLTWPSLVVFLAFYLAESYLDLVHPTWVVIGVSLLARPLLWIWDHYTSRLANARNARARNAIIAPAVKDRWPGGLGLDIIATIRENLMHGYPGDYILQWSKEYGNTFSTSIMSETRLFTVEPAHVKALLVSQFDDFEKGATLIDTFMSFLGTGVFNSDGAMWKFHRSMTRPYFTREKISHFQLFDHHSEDAIAQTKARLAEGHPIDFQEVASRFTFDAATEFLCGRNFGSLGVGLAYPGSSGKNVADTSDHPADKMVDAMLVGQQLIVLRSRSGPSWPLTEFWHDKVKPHRETIDRLVEPIVDDALRKTAHQEKKTDGDTDTLLEHLVSVTQDKQLIMDEIFNVMMAGRDTTTATLTFAVYMLAENPHVTRRLREEILGTVGPNGRPSYDDIRDMKYLRAFINETLRLYPPVPIDSRTSNKATTLPQTSTSPPIYVPPNTRCYYAVSVMQRRTDLWGPDAAVFDPDRFLDDRMKKYLLPNPLIFLPFNAGPRICLGQQFAYNEASYFLVRLLQAFSEFTLAPDAQPADSLPPPSWHGRDKIYFGSHLTTYVKGGLWMRMKEATPADN